MLGILISTTEQWDEVGTDDLFGAERNILIETRFASDSLTLYYSTGPCFTSQDTNLCEYLLPTWARTAYLKKIPVLHDHWPRVIHPTTDANTGMTVARSASTRITWAILFFLPSLNIFFCMAEINVPSSFEIRLFC